MFSRLQIILFVSVVQLLKAEDKYAIAGNNPVTLVCSGTDAPSWTLNGTAILMQGITRKYELDARTLIIKFIVSEDFGTYKCNDQDNILLLQGHKPVLIETFTSGSFLTNNTFKLECSTSALPKVTVNWLKNNVAIPQDSNIKEASVFGTNNVVTSSLTITSAELLNTGNYTCKGNNQFGVFNHTGSINIYDPPDNLTVSVSYVSSTVITLRWSRNNNIQSTTNRNVIIILDSSKGGAAKKIFQAPVLSDNYTFTDLQPYTFYTFEVMEEVGSIKGNVATYKVMTHSGAPSKPVLLQVDSKGKTSMTISWEPPLFLNGNITQFKAYYYSYTGGVWLNGSVLVNNVTVRKVVLKDLYPFVEYTIEISEKTETFGEIARINERTFAAIPQAPPTNVKNTTQFLTNMNKVEVQLQWDAIPVYLQGGNFSGYIIKYATSDEQPPPIYHPVGKNYVKLQNLKPFRNYTVEIVGYNKIGNGEDEAVISFKTPEGRPSAPQALTVTKLMMQGSSALQLNWIAPKHMNGLPLMYQVVYRKLYVCSEERCKRMNPIGVDFSQNGSLFSFADERRVFYLTVDPYSTYSVKVRESTVAGYGDFSTDVSVTTNIGQPSKPLNLSAVSVTDTSVTIQWEAPEYPNGVITSYQVTTSFGKQRVFAQSYHSHAQGSKLEFQVSALESEATYNIKVQAFNGISGSLSDALYVTTKAPAPAFPWLFVLIGCLATILLIALMVTIFLLVSRRNAISKYKGVKSAEEIDMSGYPQSKPVTLAELKQYCLHQHANSDHLFQQEFESVRVPTQNYSFEHSQMPYNQSKNRYSNILAYDHSRVMLNAVENEIGSTYINGNYIDGFKHPKKYIATQGPLPETVLDFWRMIWEQNVPVIVMLTKLIEDNRIKCEQYWPPGDGLQYKDIVVKVLSISEMTDYTVRIFQLYKFNTPEAGKRIVRQYHYTVWPDHGVPSHPTSMLSFIRHVMSYSQVTRPTINQAKKLDGPTIVHCSAGVGRTGTFIAIESCLEQIESDKRVDVYGTTIRMRKQRNFMVQTESQYTFIYDALLDSVICGNTEIAPVDLVAKIRFLNERDPNTGETNFAAEFKRLESGILLNDHKHYSEASHPENKHKNRFINALPYNKNRVKLIPIAGIRQSDYINASIVDGFQQKNAFIAAQAPLENTVNDFWRMVLEKNVHIIVMLTKLEEKGTDKCYLYWPQASTVSYGNVLVGFIDSKQEDNIAIHQLRITNKQTQQSWTVTHYNYLGWPDFGHPETGTELIHLIGLVQRNNRDIPNETGPILVHCSGGVGRSGVFISVLNSIERLKAKDVVDVFQTTRALRLQRTAMVQTINQYMFCYQALKDYLDSFDLYANPQC